MHDLRRRIYAKAKAEPSWRFWGLYVHVCKIETLREAYELAKNNDGAPGSDGVTFEAIEAQGAETLLKQLRDELIGRTYTPLPARRQEIPRDGGRSASFDFDHPGPEPEIDRLTKARRDADFEEYFAKERSKYAHLWENKGFFGGIGIHSKIRQIIRKEFEGLRA